MMRPVHEINRSSVLRIIRFFLRWDVGFPNTVKLLHAE